MLNFVKRAIEVRKERTALMNMSWTQMNDLGLSLEDIKRESRKAFWQMPRRA